MDTSSGRKYGNLETQRLHESRTQGAEKENDSAEEPEAQGDRENIDQVVEEHGPADESTIKSEDDGSYSVHSKHGKHKHVSKGHQSVEEAHHHSMKAHGAEMDEHEGGDDEGDEIHSGGASIPTMR